MRRSARRRWRVADTRRVDSRAGSTGPGVGEQPRVGLAHRLRRAQRRQVRGTLMPGLARRSPCPRAPSTITRNAATAITPISRTIACPDWPGSSIRASLARGEARIQASQRRYCDGPVTARGTNHPGRYGWLPIASMASRKDFSVASRSSPSPTMRLAARARITSVPSPSSPNAPAISSRR